MARAHKQASGKWMCTGYNGTLKKQRRFYGRTRQEAERLAAEFSGITEDDITAGMTFYDAAQGFLSDRARVLSPNTIRGYTGIVAGLSDMHDMPIGKIDSKFLQRFVSDLAGRVSPKTVSNRYRFITAVIRYHRPETVFRVKLPDREDKKIVMPSEDEIKMLLEAVKGDVLEVPVLLALFGPMRRGEIAALDAADVDGSIIHVRAAIAKSETGAYVRKQPKTKAGDRYIPMPAFVAAKLPTDGKITPLTPDAITRRFERLTGRIGLNMTFHQLRHWSVSYLHRAGLSDQEILDRAGWKSTGIFRDVYRHGLKGADRATAVFQKFGAENDD
jgi:integrase